MYGLIVDNKSIEVIDKARCSPWRVGKASSKYEIAFTSLDDILLEVYSTVIYKIYTFLYSIKLHIEFTKGFNGG